ncbi:glycoside hydrolase family protein [Shewanella algae]|uniref:glycoside hydrolase family protein n=1 Tax=Shewanella algae TaxID=38313 RepID=UPI0031F5239E
MSHYDDVVIGPIHPELLQYATADIADEEGFRDTPYYDSEGYPTVGYGQRLGPRHTPLEFYQFSLPQDAARQWLRSHVINISAKLAVHPAIAPAFAKCNLERQVVLVSMAYQMGIEGLAGFKNMLNAITAAQWAEAASHALDSLWARQTPARAQRHAEMLKRGLYGVR